MSGPAGDTSRLRSAVGRATSYLLPAERRDWADAVWAEAYEVPPGLPRLRWRAGGIRLITREALMARRVRLSLLFAVSAAYLAWTALPGTPSALLTAIMWLRTIGTVVLLAGLPWLIRRRLGPVIDSRLAHWLRVATYAGLMALIVALAEREHVTDTPQKLAAAGPHNQPSVGLLMPWSAFLILVAGYVAIVLAVTARRSRVTPTTLSIGTGTGIALGVVMYAIMPLGFGNVATAPWLRGSAIDPLVVVAWVLLFGGPVVAALLAGWRCRGSAGPLGWGEARIRQGVAAGILVPLVGSLVVCVLGPVTMALMLRAGWLAHSLYPGRHLSAAAVANLVSHYFPAGYFLIWLAFPIVGICLASLTALCAWGNQAVRERGHGSGGGGPGGPELAPEPPPAGWPGDVGYEQSAVAVGLFVSSRPS
jgi:hypothetical protein